VHGGEGNSGEGGAGRALGVGMVGAEGGAMSCHETGGAAGRRAWSSLAGEMAGGQKRGLRPIRPLIGAGVV
jgi:hypothetical protein